MQRWMIVTVEGEPCWPTDETEVDFNGRTFFLRPLEGTSAPDVRTRYDHPDEELEAFQAVCSLLSHLSWWQRRPIRGVLRLSSTAPMRGGTHRPSPMGWPGFALSPLMEVPANEKARRAIAIYREALSVQSTPYEFLGYMKIVNILYPTGNEQIAWINAALPVLQEWRALERIDQLRADYEDIGEYLYASGRCAVAHAYDDPVVNPDNPADLFRLAADMPIARALAEHLIEHELTVPWNGS